MTEFVLQIKPYLEILYYICVLVLAIVGVIGLRQIFLVKYDIRTRNLRAANKEAIALIDRYLEKYVAINKKHTLQMEKDNVPNFKGQVGDFCYKEVDLERVGPRLRKGKYILEMLNELEIIAAGVNSKLANEELAFYSFGKSFCGTVENNYDLVSFLRGGGTIKHYNNRELCT